MAPQTLQHDPLDPLHTRETLQSLRDLRNSMLELARQHQHAVALAHPLAAPSASNLLHYIALRQHDTRPLQRQLLALGLSSLGRCQPWALGSVQAVIHAASRLLDPPSPITPQTPDALDLDRARALLDRRTNDLFGQRPPARAVRMMLTMPDEAAHEPPLLLAYLQAGIDAIRINTASGSPPDWLAIIHNLRAAPHPRAQTCKVCADLAGPKVRVRSISLHGQPMDHLKLNPGDSIAILRAQPHPSQPSPKAHPAIPDPAIQLAIDPPQAIANAQPGHQIWFDDGKVGGLVQHAHHDRLDVAITFTKPGGQRLRLSKGVNLPDTPIDLPALTAQDLDSVRALWGHVDALALSFVRGPEDVADLRLALDRFAIELGGPAPAMIVKIETRRGFERLPEILLELLRVPVAGVMLARGDLAVECGFQRLAEIQEEVLEFCEAAHTPVIWATEVLATLAKQGRPTRAEITDAAMAQRAECVMLNKGPQILMAIQTLHDILVRMQGHQRKRTAMFRPLSIATGYHTQKKP